MSYDGALCYTKDVEAFNIIRDLLRRRSINVVIRVSNAGEATQLIKRNPRKILVVDWDVGPKDGVKVLSSAAKPGDIQMRPILLLSSRNLPTISGIVNDYGVTSVYMGKMSEETLEQPVERLFTDFIPPEMAETLAKVAEARASDDWRVAGALLDQLEEKYPNDPRIIIEVVENHLYFNEVDDAIMYLTPLVSDEKADVRVINSYSRALMKAGKFEEASLAMRRANVINPHNVDRLIGMGKAYLNMDWIDQALENFDSALKLDEDNEEALQGKGQALAMQGDFDEALKMMKRSSSPRESSSMFNTAAIMAIRRGRHAEGIHLYQLAARAAGEDKKLLARVAFNMAIGYHRWKKPEKAFYYFSLASHMDPGYADAKHNASVIREHLHEEPQLKFSQVDPMKSIVEGAGFSVDGEPSGVDDRGEELAKITFEDERF